MGAGGGRGVGVVCWSGGVGGAEIPFVEMGDFFPPVNFRVGVGVAGDLSVPKAAWWVLSVLWFLTFFKFSFFINV